MVDAVVRVLQNEIGWEEPDLVIQTHTQFYADDGLIVGINAERVQQCIDVTSECFGRLGLSLNHQKTKSMIIRVGNLKTRISDQAYSRRILGEGDSYRERMKEIVS